MGKRSNFERRERDFYETPESAVLPLLKFLPQGPKGVQYIEPCVGNGALIQHLGKHGHECVFQSDIDLDVRTTDYRKYTPDSIYEKWIITNPPWSRDILHPAIENLSKQYKTWLLFDADWMHTKQARPFLKKCVWIVSVGRVKWIENSKHTGKDNCCWYLFDSRHNFDFNTTFFNVEK